MKMSKKFSIRKKFHIEIKFHIVLQLENIDAELNDLQSEIDKQLEDQKSVKIHRKVDGNNIKIISSLP